MYFLSVSFMSADSNPMFSIFGLRPVDYIRLVRGGGLVWYNRKKL